VLRYDDDHEEILDCPVELSEALALLQSNKTRALKSRNERTKQDMPPQLLSLHAGKGIFSHENRTGIAGSMHSIVCLRDREGDIRGLTYRVGMVSLFKSFKQWSE
jgi:hypothetical protein